MKNTTFIFFGITGDLARKKIIPALFELYSKGRLPDGFKVLGFIRKRWSREEFEKFLAEVLSRDVSEINDFLSMFSIFYGDIQNKNSFVSLRDFLREEDKVSGVASRRIFYFAISPSFYVDIFSFMKEVTILNCGIDSVLIEKPFGRGFEEAGKLNTLLESFTDESDILRIDHYLAKDAMKNILEYKDKGVIEKIEARIIEKHTIENRGVFYDAVGAFLDVGENHILQMLASFLVVVLQGKQTKETILESLSVRKGSLEKGQYEGYRQEVGVNPESKTETYFKIELKSNLPELNDLFFVIEAGKAFGNTDASLCVSVKNTEKIFFDFNRKKESSLDPYAKIILASIEKDYSLFVTKGEVMAQWKIAKQVEDVWRDIEPSVYQKGKIIENK